MLNLAKYSFGVGDRFAHQATAQLRAFVKAAELGVEVVPVWNKSNREHVTIGSEPSSVRSSAEAAVRELNWNRPYHVDADHIRLETVDRFIPHSDFYTIDVADFIGRPADPDTVKQFCRRHAGLAPGVDVPGIGERLRLSPADIETAAGKFLLAVQEAGCIHRHIAGIKGSKFIAEVSMDETDRPQTPAELLIILAAIADERIPVQTIAPKFTGRFNKGVDYSGDLVKFEEEFNDDLAVIAYAVGQYGLPASLKLSVHSGSDKFSIYAPIRKALKRFDSGLHLKTAGTTWLEELIGLAEAGGDGLALAKEIYGEALAHHEELCAPYAAVIDIDKTRLPGTADVKAWTSQQFVNALRHDLRQLLHVGYKMAAKAGNRYLRLLEECEATIAKNVTHNIFERHLKPLFIGG
jgi:hypothetical protein